MSNSLFKRIQLANEYIALYANLESRDWHKDHEKFVKDELRLTEKILMVHPKYFMPWIKPDYAEDEIKKILGIHESSEFPSGQYKRRNKNCQSDLFWGYNCPIKGGSDSKIEYDHHFPRSFGGPTESSNMIRLCQFHNQKLKSSDIHFYSWEKEPHWLNFQISNIRKYCDF